MIKTRFKLDGAFVLHVADVQAIYDAVAEFEGTPWTPDGTGTGSAVRLVPSGSRKPTITATCADDFVRSFDSVDDLAAFSNDLRRQILRLTISTTNALARCSAHVTIEQTPHIAPISVEATGDTEPDVVRLREQLSVHVDGTRAWYAWVRCLRSIPAGLVVCAISMTLSYALLAANAIVMADGSSHYSSTAPAVIALTAVILAPLWFIPLLSWIVERFFPSVTFALGQGVARLRTAESIRWSVIVGAIINVLVGVVLMLRS